MYSLSDKQIDFILSDIGARGVKTEDLQYNLLDHVCCIIENELEENGDFAQFYNKTISRFYKKELKELEDETQLLLTFKNYYTMKKLMIISGAFATTTFVFGSFFKIMHWPGASLLFFLGMITGCFLFLPLVFTLKARESKSIQNKLIAGVGTLDAILFCLSSLFKVFHWPGANIIWLVTLGVLFFVFIPLYFFYGIRNPETKVNTIVTSVMLVMIAGSLFLLTGLRGRTVSGNDAYVYMQTQELTKNVQNSLLRLPDSENKKALLVINGKCELLKSILMTEEIGMPQMPSNYNEQGQFSFHEHNVTNSFFKNPVAVKALNDLKEEVKKYNSSVTNASLKIDEEHSAIGVTEDEYSYTTNFWMLNSFSVIQMQLLHDAGKVVAQK